MSKDKLIKRNSSMDILRIVAVFSVVAVHFFLNSKFYSETCNSLPMYIMVVVRTLFSVCIPLFLILTGYLMCKKVLCKKYYRGIVKILVIYLISSIACTAYTITVQNEKFNLGEFVTGLLSYTAAPYAWYIELYIGLFLIIPFINLIYVNLSSQKKKRVLVLTLIVLTVLPTLFNIFSFTGETVWYAPADKYATTKILPQWWQMIYPLTYYFTGCYLREYGLKLKSGVLILILSLEIIVFGTFNFMRSYEKTFEYGLYIDWNGFEPYCMSVIIFELIRRIKANKFQRGIRYVLMYVSNAALGIYLLSYIFDDIFYKLFNVGGISINSRLWYFFVVVPVVFACSVVLSLIITGGVNTAGNVLAEVFHSLFSSDKQYTEEDLQEGNATKPTEQVLSPKVTDTKAGNKASKKKKATVRK